MTSQSGGITGSSSASSKKATRSESPAQRPDVIGIGRAAPADDLRAPPLELGAGAAVKNEQLPSAKSVDDITPGHSASPDECS